MRTVAVALVILCVLAAFPLAAANNECVNDPMRQQACVRLDARKPATPPNTPAVPDTPYWDEYYLFVGAGVCATGPLTPACRGVPPAPGSGVPDPDGSGTLPLPGGVFGVLWQESNNQGGLQRTNAFGAAADRMVLV